MPKILNSFYLFNRLLGRNLLCKKSQKIEIFRGFINLSRADLEMIFKTLNSFQRSIRLSGGNFCDNFYEKRENRDFFVVPVIFFKLICCFTNIQ